MSSTGCAEDCGTYSPSYSSSMDDSFHIISQESVDPADNDTAAAGSQRNHISLTEQDTSAPENSGETAGEAM